MDRDMLHLYVRILKHSHKVLKAQKIGKSYHITLEELWPIFAMTYILSPVED